MPKPKSKTRGRRTDEPLPGSIKLKGRLFSQGWVEESGRRDVVSWDVFNVQDGETLTMVFESKRSRHRQGVWLWTDAGIIINGQLCRSADLWSDTAPSRVAFQCRTANGKLSVYNIWDHGDGRESQCHSSGMLVTELSNGRRYRCNDIGFEGKFDKLVFRIERSLSGRDRGAGRQRVRVPSRTKHVHRGRRRAE
jgi:hypothetical protein